MAENQGSNPSVDLSGQDEKARAKARIGKTIKGKYRLDSMLGIGGMATVYGATHRNGSRIALKILHSEFARDDAIRDRFLREGYVANKVDHPGRVAILDDDVSEEGDAFLVMELLEGEELQKLWKRYSRKVPVPEALEIGAQALDVLHAFHEVGVVHRDIKPANIFVTKEKVVKLLDFGVARMREAGGDKTRAGTALGTPSFMAPEQAMGLTDGVDGRADVFSIGATLYAILSGQRLHQGRSDNEAFILAATQPAPSLARVAPDLPVEIIALVDKALAWDPRNRFESAASMRDECLQLLAQFKPGAAPVATAQAPGVAQPAMPAAGVAPKKEEPVVEPPATEGDPAVQRLLDFFRRVERLLPTVRQYGWQHPEADNKLRAAHQGLVEAVREDPNAVYWGLLPYSFVHRTIPVWEPTAPFDVVPYNLFAAGIRSFRVLTGVTEKEVRGLCEVFLIDPAKDLTPEDDVASALWERRLDHIKYDVINVFAEGDAADREAFYEETDALEGVAKGAADERANRAEAAAMNVQVDNDALKVVKAAGQVLALDQMQKNAVAAQLETSPERWSERFVDVLADAFIDTIKRRDTQLVAEPLDASARDLVLSRRFDVVFPMHDAIRRSIEVAASQQRYPGLDARTVGGHVTRAMFGPETLRLLLVEAIRSNQQAIMQGAGAAQSAAINLDQLAQQLQPIFADLGNDHVAAVTGVLDQTQHDGLRRVLFGFLQRVMAGREHEIADKIPNMSIDTARPLLRLLQSIQTQGGFDQLRRLASSGNATLKCEATAYLAQTPDQLKDELTRLTEHPQPDVRQAALRTMAYHQVRSAGPLLVKRVQDPTFNQLPSQERRELFSALYVLNPQRGEQLAVEIVQKHGLLVDEQLEETRAICADLLGQNSKTMEALDAVLQASKRRWWNTQPLRESALAAAEAIAARLGRRISAAGEVI